MEVSIRGQGQRSTANQTPPPPPPNTTRNNNTTRLFSDVDGLDTARGGCGGGDDAR